MHANSTGYAPFIQHAAVQNQTYLQCFDISFTFLKPIHQRSLLHYGNDKLDGLQIDGPGNVLSAAVVTGGQFSQHT